MPSRLLALVLFAACALAVSHTPAVDEPKKDKEKDKAKEKGKPNNLAKSSSPYLLQHAHNPVDWYPWGPEAFEKAKKEKKLVFLSIGYSACHWCHVMEQRVVRQRRRSRSCSTRTSSASRWTARSGPTSTTST